MKKIEAEIKNGRIRWDFSGFSGDSCSQEEAALRLLLGKMGVRTDIVEEDKKKEEQNYEYEGEPEKEKH